VKAIFKHLRLLPAVVIVGLSVLAIKGIDIARAAQGAVEDLDNAGLAPSDASGPARPDYANGEDPSDSASEVDVLTSLTHRREELDGRERGLSMRENLLNASEGRVNQKIAALQALQTQIQGLLKQRDTAQQDQITSLIKSYGPDGMKPAQAATIFNTMPDEVLIPIAKGMKPGDLGAIMSKMNPDAAQKLTVKLAALLKLPETATAAACPVPSAASPLPGTTADATPPEGSPPVTLDNPPTQTAAAAPPPTPAPATTAPAAAPAPAKPLQTAATTPPAPAKPQPAPVTPAPAKPTTTAAAAPPPKPHHAPPHHVARTAPPPKSTNPPVTLDNPPSQAAAATPPKPTTTTPVPAQSASATSPKPAATTPAPAAVTPPKPSATTPAPAQAAAATPPSVTPASGSPTPLTH
jgi:flagellar motility protein MotE (MotC chaperone)